MTSLGRKGGNFKGRVGAFVMFLFGVVALARLHQTGNLFFALLLFRDLIAAAFLYRRRPAEKSASHIDTGIAYFSSALPLIYLRPVSQVEISIQLCAQLLMIIGFLVSTLATIELSEKMGIAPAQRGDRCESGIYRLLRHPMYTGYGIAELGIVVTNSLNWLIFIPSLLAYFYRARVESKILKK